VDFFSAAMAPTRYFMFSRVNPRDDDYDLLLAECGRLNVYVGFRTVISFGVTRLVGFLMFTEGRVSHDVLARALPNFLVVPMVSTDPPIDESKGFTYFGGHPFHDIKRLLFK
jgi:hypothetical protein